MLLSQWSKFETKYFNFAHYIRHARGLVLMHVALEVCFAFASILAVLASVPFHIVAPVRETIVLRDLPWRLPWQQHEVSTAVRFSQTGGRNAYLILYTTALHSALVEVALAQ